MRIHHGTTEEILPAMTEACLNASKTIYLEQYLIENDPIGAEFIDILCQKAKEGVEVRCLFDALGSFNFGQSSLPARLIAAGAQVRFFNWLRPFAHHNQKFLYFRN